jgi:hypothetical protein
LSASGSYIFGINGAGESADAGTVKMGLEPVLLEVELPVVDWPWLGMIILPNTNPTVNILLKNILSQEIERNL